MTERASISNCRHRRREPVLSRRALVGALSLGAAAIALQACGEAAVNPEPIPQGSEPSGDAADFSARFTAFEPADEPNGDLSKVVWPDYVVRAGADIQRLYEYQVLNGGLMRYMPCFCGCGRSAGHQNNRDCYVESVNAEGVVVFDPMAPT